MTTGKIFTESTDVFQDQARIVFEYYRKAAERIVNEELRIEKEISVAEETCQQMAGEIGSLKPRMIGAFAAAAVLLLLYFKIDWIAVVLALGAVGYGVYALSQSKRVAEKLAASQASIEGFRRAHSEIRRDYKVHKLGLAYVPVAREIPFEGKSFLIDLTESTPKKEFRLSTVRRGELFTSTIGELEELLREAPVVEASTEMEEVRTDQYSLSIQNVSRYDYLGNLDRKMRTTAFCLEDLDSTSVDLPTIAPGGKLAQYLKTHGTDDPGAAPVFRAFDTTRFDTELDTFRSLNEMKKSLERHSAQFEDVLRKLMLNMAQAVQSVSRSKMTSTGVLVDESNRLMFNILKAPYNHYSPKLEAEEIERIRLETFNYQDSVESYRPFQLKPSSRVLFDLVSGSWVAEDGTRTMAPFGISQIQEEIIAPIVQNLMMETRVERLKIYNNIKDQKLDYLTQWHRDTEDFYGRNRAESNELINQMRSTFSDFISNYNALAGLEKTEKNMAASGSLKDAVTESGQDGSEVVASYEVKSGEFQTAQEDFAEYMERLKEDIDRRAGKYGFIEYFDASLRDAGARSSAEAADKAHDLEPRRKPLLAVNAYYAASSELPPSISIDPSAYENLGLNLESIARDALSDLDSQTPLPPRAAGAAVGAG